MGHLTSREQQGVRTSRTRPSGPVFALTDAGRAEFYQAYDQLAIQALGYLQQVGGDEAVKQFARQVVADVESASTMSRGIPLPEAEARW